MKCKYCFYYDTIDYRNKRDFGFMNEETLDVLVRRVYQERFNSVNFSFQGGEPLLIGLDYYTKLIEYVEKYNISNITTTYSLQTNGTLITIEFAAFFRQNNFLIGISVDGSKEVHDQYRGTKESKGSYYEV